MKLSIINDKVQFLNLKERWNETLAQSPADSVFLTWEWLYTWWEVFGDSRRQLHIVTIENNGELALIAPFIITRRTQAKIFNAKVLEFLGTGEDQDDEVCSNYMDILVKDLNAVDLFAKYIKEGSDKKLWDEIHLKSVTVGAMAEKLLKNIFNGSLSVATTPPDACARINLPGTWEDYMKTLSKSWRDQIKRGRKEAASLGTIETRYVTEGAHVQNAFEQFTNLHRVKWEAEGKKWLFASSRFSNFQKRILERFAKNGWAGFHELRINGKLAASSFKYEFNSTIYFYLPAYDPVLKTKIGLGLIERSYDIELSIKSKTKYYDFYKARPGSYKWHLAKDRREVFDVGVYEEGVKFIVLSGLRAIKGAGLKVRKLCLGKRD